MRVWYAGADGISCDVCAPAPSPKTRPPATAAAPPTTYVLGLGNVLMGDDGIGPAVVRAFESQYVAGANVELVDVGTPGLDLMPWLADAGHVIIVDAVKSSAPPGAVRVYSKEDLMRHAPFSRVGPHDPGVKEALLTLEFAGRGPADVTVIGVVPQKVGTSLTLSDPVREAIPCAVEAIRSALQAIGVEIHPREQAEAARPWWAMTAVANDDSEASG